LVLLDLNLPRVSGLEVLRRLKGHQRFQAIPVIMLTSSAEDRDVRAAYGLGVNSYIVKPADFGRLQEIAATIVGYWGRVNTPPRAAGSDGDGESRPDIEAKVTNGHSPKLNGHDSGVW